MKMTHEISGTRVCCLYRVSTKGQVDQNNNDIPMQREECRRFALQQGWTVVAEHSELGVSGSKVSAAKRDAIQDIKRQAENKEFDILLVFMFDRLGRIESETPFVLEWFVKLGIEVWSTKEGQQRLDNHSDKLINYIRFWQAAGESEKTAIRVKTRMKQLVEDGCYMGGTVPFGYMLVDKGRLNKKKNPVKDLAVDPIEGPIVREMFEKIINEGYSCYMLTKMLNDRGIKTHGGARFQRNHVMRIVNHRGYTGYMITKSAQSNFMAELQIIDEETYKKAQSLIEDRRVENNAKRSTPSKYDTTLLCAGVAYCGDCGTRLSGYVQNRKMKRKDGTEKLMTTPLYFCYAKSQKVRECHGQQNYKAEIVDNIINKIAIQIFSVMREKPTLLESNDYAALVENQQRDLEKALKEKLSTAEKKLERFKGMILDSMDGNCPFDQETLAGMIKDTKAEIETLDKQIKDARDFKTKAAQNGKNRENYYKEFKGWAEEYETASPKRKQIIIGQLFSRIELYAGYKVKVYLNISYKEFLQGDEVVAKIQSMVA